MLIRKYSSQSGRFEVLLRLAPLLVLAVAAGPLFAKGTPEETWQEAAGNEVWRHEFDLSEAKPGTHNIIIRARDAAGNETLEGPYNIRIDPSAGLPTTRIVYPEKDTVLRQDVQVIGVAEGRRGLGRVELKLNDEDFRPAQGGEYWSALLDVENMEDGRHRVTAKALETGGGEGAGTSVSFILDREPPRVEILSHQSGALIRGNVDITGRADDANGIAKTELSSDGGKTYRELKFKSQKGSTEAGFSFSLQTRRIEDGAVIYRIRATDKTGAQSVTPVLFFVDNEPPELEILSHEDNAVVCSRFRITGMIRDVVGVQSLSCEFNKETRDIELRPGDPYWATDILLPPGTGRNLELLFTALDKNGNKTVLKRRLQHDPSATLPKVRLDYSGDAQLGAFPSDGALYGQVAGGQGSEAVQIEGGNSYRANPGFRIPGWEIGPGRSDLRILPLMADGSPGESLRVRVNRLPVTADAPIPSPEDSSPIMVEKPQASGYFSQSFELAGRMEEEGGDRLEYRLGPGEPWIDIPIQPGGDFSASVSLNDLPDGPVHLELRSAASGGEEKYPVYHPINKKSLPPEILFFSPRSIDEINGNITVSGFVRSQGALSKISFTLDGETYTDLDGFACTSGSYFSFVTDFTALDKAGGRLLVRALDQAGNTATAELGIPIDSEGDRPRVELHLPADGDLVIRDFVISGLAFDDDGVAAVHYRIDDQEFRRVPVEQSFRIAVPLDAVQSGERTIEVYGEDIYGLEGAPVTAVIRVSTDAPQIRLTEPVFDAYNRGSITLRGTAEDSNGIAEIRVSLDNGNTFQLAQGKEIWSLPLNTRAYKDGVYSVLVVGVDNYGVESRISSLISIDNTPPEVSIGEPADGRISGGLLRISGQLADNIRIDSLSFELSPVDSGGEGLKVEMEPRDVILETIDISSLPSGQYNLRMIATDGAGNSSVVVRNLELAKESTATQVVLFNPLPGTNHTGPLAVSGQVSGPAVPRKITIYTGEGPIAVTDVDRFGFFHHLIEESLGEGLLSLFAGFTDPEGENIRSIEHPVYIQSTGPVLTIDSHRAGEAVNGRPWLKGQAWLEISDKEEEEAGKKAGLLYQVRRVRLSLDNGRSFRTLKGGKEWKYRLETGELPQGFLPILVRAEFADGRMVTQRLPLRVDTASPTVNLASPQEGSLHSDSLLMYGTAFDEFGLDSIDVNLRQGDKLAYGVPRFIQGLYLDSHFLGATFADFGAGVSFFDDAVKLQVQAGQAPPGRFTGNVIGAKLLANVFHLPFDYIFGPDWSFFSMAFALGANFSYFTMDEDHPSLVMSAVLLQWEFARFQIADWKAFRSISLYLEPNLWFASSDVEAGAIFKMAAGIRVGIF